MAKLNELINKIRTAIYGKDVRSAIADSIEAMNIENQEVSYRQSCLGETFNNLIYKHLIYATYLLTNQQLFLLHSL